MRLMSKYSLKKNKANKDGRTSAIGATPPSL